MIANGTLKTIEDEKDIYISLTQLCEYFAESTVKMRTESEFVNPAEQTYAKGLIDMMETIAREMVDLGKFEAQRRMIINPEDLLNMIDKNPFGIVE